MVKERWTDNDMKKFIKLYKNCGVLWNPKCKDYRNKLKRDAAYTYIQHGMERKHLTFADIKNKIRSLRNTFRLEKNKILKSLHSTAPLSHVYRPNLTWFDKAATFLGSVESSSSSDVQDITSMKSTTRQRGKKRASVALNSLKRKAKSEMGSAKRRKTEESPNTSEAKATSTRDQYFNFGQFVANELRNMSTTRAAYCQSSIQQLLKKQRQEYQKEQLKKSKENAKRGNKLAISIQG